MKHYRNSIHKIVITGLVLILSATVTAQNKDKVLIEAMLAKQTAAWNNGNIEQFMVGYWNSDSLLFIGKNGPTYGYKNTLTNYKKSYPDTETMGKLKSTIISISKISNNNYFVVGKWYLTRSIGDVFGHYTLLLKKINGLWVVVADHSS